MMRGLRNDTHLILGGEINVSVQQRCAENLPAQQSEEVSVQQIKSRGRVWRNNLPATEAALHLSSPP